MRSLLLLTCLLYLPAAAPAQDVDSALASVVRISGTRGETPVRGSGFVVALSGGVATVVTASHVIEGARFEVAFAASATDRFPVDAGDVLGMEGGDPNGLAVFLVRGAILAGVAALAFDVESRPQAAESLLLVGFPQRLRTPLTIRRTYAGRRGTLLLLDLPVGEGFSGGPAVSFGKVVGVVTTEDEQFTYAVNALVAREFVVGSGVVLGGRAPVTATPVAVQYSELQYQDRGDRHEGLRAKPVSGYDIALLSARVDYREESEGWPEKLRLRFYLPEPREVFVTVRQLRPKTTYYWLDQVKPASPWRAGELNEYAWPTAAVLRKLTSVTADNLGTVVRLGRELPGKAERVAPAVFYHSRAPAAVKGYRFTLKTNGTACVTARIYRGETGDTEVFLRRRPPQTRDHCRRDGSGIRERAGSPFTVRWPSAGQPEGWYRLMLSGYFESDNAALDKKIVFYHKAKLGPAVRRERP